jgi:hypothetical protein
MLSGVKTLYQTGLEDILSRVDDGELTLKYLRKMIPERIYQDVLDQIIAKDRSSYYNKVHPFFKAELVLKEWTNNWIDDHVDREPRDICIEVKHTDFDDYEDNGYLVIRESESSDWEYYFHFLWNEYQEDLYPEVHPFSPNRWHTLRYGITGYRTIGHGTGT